MKTITDKFQIIIPPQDISCEPGLQEKLAAGDREAFAWVYKNYCKKIYNYALLMTNNPEQSEDIVHDLFLKLWRNKEKITGLENFNGYLMRMCRNYVLDMLRDGKKEKNKANDYFERLTFSVNEVDDIINVKETQQLIATAIKSLPTQQKAVIFFSREMGMKNREVAKILHKTEKTMRGQLYEGLKRVRELIGR